MSSVTFGSHLMHEVMQLGLCLVFLGFAVVSHVAQSAEASFPLKKDTLAIQPANSGTHWLPAYRTNAKIDLGWPKRTASTRPKFSTPRQSLLLTKPQKEWSIAIQRQDPANLNCSSISPDPCLNSLAQAVDMESQHDSLWFVLSKPVDF
jgi:hypothetical protein